MPTLYSWQLYQFFTKKDDSHLQVDESIDDENTVFANLGNNDDEDKDDDYNREYVYEEEGCTRDSKDSL